MIDVLILIVLPLAAYTWLAFSTIKVIREREENETFDYFAERIIQTTQELLKDDED